MRQVCHRDAAHVLDTRLGLQRPAQMGCWIGLCPARGNRELEHLTYALFRPAADVERAARFDFPNHSQHVGRSDLLDVHGSKHRQHIAFEPRPYAGGVSRVQTFHAVLVPQCRDPLERFGVLGRSAHHSGHRILALGQRVFGIEALLPGGRETGFRVGTE
jgi:hypothetical protein